ncbi:MAG TPA: IS110 family transposase [Lacipirellulaceae bacterium]|nr:IS110 family transposase [Lacipirellulaceae bacterium]
MSHPTVGIKSFVGVDLHKCTVTLAAVDAGGEILGRLTISTKSVQKIEDWLLGLPRPSQMAVEACPFVEWFIERYTPCVDRMEIADATQLANLRGKRRKTDRNDSLDIACRLSRGECPLGYIADPTLMQFRKMGRHWRRLSQLLGGAKRAMKSMLNAANLHGPKFDGAGAQRWLLAHGHLLHPVQRRAFGNYLDLLLLIERHRETLRREILLAHRPENFEKTENLLKTVPGIGDIWGLIIAAEIGPFERFPNADALEFWAGLTADLKASAGRTQSGNITKAGNATLRWALCQAAVTLCQCDARQAAIRRRLIRRVGKARANVAMGRRLLRTLYAMVRKNNPYCGGPRIDRTTRMNRAKTARKRAKGSGKTKRPTQAA